METKERVIYLKENPIAKAIVEVVSKGKTELDIREIVRKLVVNGFLFSELHKDATILYEITPLGTESLKILKEIERK